MTVREGISEKDQDGNDEGDNGVDMADLMTHDEGAVAGSCYYCRKIDFLLEHHHRYPSSRGSLLL